MPTYTLMPNAVGDKAENTPIGDTPNWKCCDENPHDSDITYVRSSLVDEETYIDLYNVEPATGTIPAGETITNVAVIITSRSINATYKAIQYTKIKTGGIEYTGSLSLPPITYTEYTTNYAVNPQTGVAWTLANLDALQAGVQIESVMNHLEIIYSGRCTQVKIVVTTTAVAAAVLRRNLVGVGL